jgi:alcohol dehydrogenase class IV
MAGSVQVFEGHLLGQIYDLGLLPKLWFGIGVIERLGEIGKGIAENNNAVIVTDEVLVKAGMIDSAKESLESAGFDVDLYAAKATEPVLDEVRQVVAMVRAKDY